MRYYNYPGNINDSYPTNAAEVDSKLTELVNISCDDSLTDYERLQILCLIQKVAQRNPQVSCSIHYGKIPSKI